MEKGHLYLVAIIDWYSRYVLSWELSNTLDQSFCLEALDKSFAYGQPEIFNTDQGSQFTSEKFTEQLASRKIKISWDGKGRALDNIFVERLWRSVKYEEVYINCYSNFRDARRSLGAYFEFYNTKRYHQSLNYRTPKEVHCS